MSLLSALETRPLLRRLMSLVAFLGFAASLLVHLETYLGTDLSRSFPGIWALHLGIFLVCIPMVFSSRRSSAMEKGWRSDLFGTLPDWARYLVVGFFIYAILNFVSFMVLTEGGVPAQRDGKFVLLSHGRVIRNLSEGEYTLQKAYVLRGFSGHWMMFYLLPAFYFWFPKPGRESFE